MFHSYRTLHVVLARITVTDHHHLILGQYVSYWGGLEVIVNRIISMLFSDDGSGIQRLVANLSIRDKIDSATIILEDQFNNSVSPEQKIDIKRFVDTVKRISVRRNKIVHGEWISINDQPFARVTSGLSDNERFSLIPGNSYSNRSFSARNLFTLKSLEREISRIKEVSRIGGELLLACAKKRLAQRPA